jgi:ceramide glucosyltransferase
VLATWVRRGRSNGPAPAAGVAVTVFKPLCGAEPRLYENLRTFFLQDHPCFQLVFGVREAGDPALAVVARLHAEFPQVDATVVADPRVHGINLKVSNLINQYPLAKHDWLVLADSDIAAPPDCLRRVTAPLADPGIGIVTCLYRGRSLGGLWSRLGRAFIDEWFLPSVNLARLLGSTRYGFGATTAIRRDTLLAIGGFDALAGHVADDYYIGEYPRRLGLATVLSECEVVTDVAETTPRALVHRELRWLRTIRNLDPAGYAGSFVCFTTPVALIGYGLSGGNDTALALLLGAMAGRLVLHYGAMQHAAEVPSMAERLKALALLPVRDALSLALWVWAAGGGRIRWRGQQMKIETQAPARN